MEKSLINIRPDKICLEPDNSSSSSFASEHKKYDRKSIATVVAISEHSDSDYRVGDKVIFDDRYSIDFQLNGKDYSIVDIEEVVATLKGDK